MRSGQHFQVGREQLARWQAAAIRVARRSVNAARELFRRTRWPARGGAPAAGKHVAVWEKRKTPVSASFDWFLLARFAGLGVLVAAFAVVLFVVDCAFEIPIDGGMPTSQTSGALLIKATDGTELAARGTIRGDALTADEISDNLKKAIVAIEDRRFFSHGAIDPRGIAKAFLRDAFRGRVREGASTITQQLARLMLLSSDRTMRRKVQEILIAAWLEHHLTKPQILARYLDTAYFGAGAYGADAAARRYFGKSAHDLDLAEAAMLAGLVRAPSQLAPHRNLDAAQARADLVLRAMAATGAATKDAVAKAIAHPATLEVAPETPSGPGYVADAAVADVKSLVGDAALDLSARTTIDAKLQASAEKAVSDILDREGGKKNASQAALVALGPDGAILAMVGGRDYDASSFNRATQAKRQPGSLFKLFVYMAALQKGATPDTRVVDRPIKIGDWEPHNFEDRYLGPMRLVDAFARSVNTVAASLAQQVGIPTVAKTAHDLGVKSNLPEVPSLALGTAEVTLLEMTRAFATIASDQDSLEPFLVQRIKSRDKILMNRPQQYAGDADPGPAKTAMRDLLRAVVDSGTGKGARLPFPTSGKTGTTQDFRDAWFIGSAPDITVGVWVGNDDNSPMNGVTGGDLPVKIWRDFVTSAEKTMDREKTGASEKVAKRDAPPLDHRNEARDDAEPQDPNAAEAANAGKTEPDEAQSGDIKPASTADADKMVSGAAAVIDTSTLAIGGQQIHLLGIAPMGGRPARALAYHLRRREVDCIPAASDTFRCTVDGDDLATTILANGGSEATPDAPADLIAAQDAAHASRRGIWRRRR